MKNVFLHNRSARGIKSRAKNQGFSMIEVLVSLVVLSIGLMGLGGLQIASLKGASYAHNRTEASLLVMDLSDRMRTNILGVADGKYRIASNYSCSSVRDCNTNECNSDQLALFDINTFSCDVSKRLPQGQLEITCEDNDCTATEDSTDKKQRLNKIHTLTVTWREAINKDQSTSDNKTYDERDIELKIVP